MASRESYHPKMLRAAAGITAVVSLALSFNGVATAAPVTQPAAATASARCDPVSTKPHYRGTVPTPQQVLGFRLGTREATNAEIGRYWAAADHASDRVQTGVFAHSTQGRPLRYALVGKAQTLGRLTAIRGDLGKLRDPATPEGEAADLIRRTPTILWIAANVHGNEPAGGDAVTQLLYELADRDDCVANAILGNAVVGLIPVQNPDGRANDRRYNANAFDMNRDWFARTQPETAGKLDLLWKYPPQLFVDEHEMGGTNYFFPPNADPIYAETPDPIYQEIEHLYGGANEAAFQSLGWRYETWQSGYDLFYQGYGDTVPTTELGAAGMTYEQGEDASYPVRVRHHFTSALGDVVHRRDASGESPASLARDVRERRGGRRAMQAGAERHFQPRPPRRTSGAGSTGVRLLPARTVRRDPARRTTPPARACRGGQAGPPHRRGRLPGIRGGTAPDDAAGRDLLDQP